MADRSTRPSIAVWAGIECTVNRVGDRYFDQLVRSGHHDRVEDLDLIATLGVRTVRYPVVWERHTGDWTWTDQRLARLRALGITPIAGLVHHGSGPAHTSLVDPAFPVQLAAYARDVAERYPWIERFTPVNEPLTTARFSGLYGHWYPHGTDDLTFLRCLLHECKATALAMAAIREITPHAQLVTTEDIGFTHATRRLAYQADFENERRWLSLDLLCGKVRRTHALYPWLRACGITADELAWFVDHPCPPDVIGCNYYCTSERYLDEELDAWPGWSHGGNGRDRYADVHATLAMAHHGIAHLLGEVHARYHRPIAITEAHLGGTRDDQLRWLLAIYDGATRARDAGADIRAVTAWAMFGLYDWHCLVTRDDGFYEPGLFDVRGGRPRETALAKAVRALAAGHRPEHPVLAGPGWWDRARAQQEAA